MNASSFALLKCRPARRAQVWSIPANEKVPDPEVLEVSGSSSSTPINIPATFRINGEGLPLPHSFNRGAQGGECSLAGRADLPTRSDRRIARNDYNAGAN